MSSKLTVVIPTHNEEENIVQTLTEVEAHVTTPHEIVVAIDHCGDDTRERVEEFIETHPNVRCVENEREGCFANAVIAGFEAVDEGAIVVMMADLSDDPRTVDVMFAKLREGYGVVCGSRYMRGGERDGGPLLQGFFSRLVGRTLHVLTIIPTRDISNAFKMYRKELLDDVEITDKWFAMSMEIAVKAYFLGYRLAEVPTTWRGRVAGESNFRVWRVWPSYLKLYLWTLLMRVRSMFVPIPQPAPRRAL